MDTTDSVDPQAPAFPCVNVVPGALHDSYGLTKRELFAAMAMQGYLTGNGGSVVNPGSIARVSVLQADALLKELAK